MRLATTYGSRPELRVLLALMAVAACILSFGWLASEMIEGDTRVFDRMILLATRDPANLAVLRGPAWLPDVARDITSLGGAAVLLLLAVIVVGFLLVVRTRGAALLVVVALAGGTLLSVVLKRYFERPRPDIVPRAVEVSTASFPSGHAMLATVTYMTLAALLTRLQIKPEAKVYVMLAAAGLSVLVGLSRIYLGVHWPTDVVAGWTVGAAWAIGCWVVARELQRRGYMETPLDDADEAAIGRTSHD